MSDFFEMREAAERILAEKKDRKLHGRIYQAMLTVIVCAGLGVISTIHQLEKPVGTVNIVSKPTITFTMVASK